MGARQMRQIYSMRNISDATAVASSQSKCSKSGRSGRVTMAALVTVSRMAAQRPMRAGQFTVPSAAPMSRMCSRRLRPFVAVVTGRALVSTPSPFIDAVVDQVFHHVGVGEGRDVAQVAEFVL